MQWTHRDHPGRCVRLAYCMNVHAAETLEELYASIQRITLALRDRLAREDQPFGIGMYVPAKLARELVEGLEGLEELADFLAEERLDAFTFNAFPFGGFQTDGLKARVFQPTWLEPERSRFTLDVARIAARLNRGKPAGAHVSISSHTGGFGAELPESGLRAGLERCTRALAELERSAGTRIVLALEAEPRSNCNDSAAAAAWLERLALGTQHVGLCLDACHSAVEFEEPRAAFELATRAGPLAKLQFSSALALRSVASPSAGLRALLALDEPRFLHQVTGRTPAGLVRWQDLPELAASGPKGASELRCHFHVPVDRTEIGAGLETTRAHADAILDAALAVPERWGTQELHLEIETYTWDVLPGAVRGKEALVDGLEREYRHVMGRLEAAGWSRAG